MRFEIIASSFLAALMGGFFFVGVRRAWKISREEKRLRESFEVKERDQ